MFSKVGEGDEVRKDRQQELKQLPAIRELRAKQTAQSKLFTKCFLVYAQQQSMNCFLSLIFYVSLRNMWLGTARKEQETHK